MNDRCFTVHEVAEKWKVCDDSVRALLKSGELAGFKVGGAWRVTDSAIRKFETATPRKKKPVIVIPNAKIVKIS